MPKIMCTGHRGFVGQHVFKLLRDNYGSDNVFGFDLPDYDFTNPTQVYRFIELNKIEIIVHIGAYADLDKCKEAPSKTIFNNAWGTTVLLEIAKKLNCKFIHTSTWAVNGRLDHPYDISKKMAEDLVRMYNKVYKLPAVILRLATMYGLGMRKKGVIWSFLEKSLRGETITIQGSGQQFRQFLWVEDAAEAYLKTIQSFPNSNGLIHEIQAKEPVSVLQLADAVYPGKTKEKVMFTKEREGDEHSFMVEPTKTLGWESQTSIKEGMEKLKRHIENDTSD